MEEEEENEEEMKEEEETQKPLNQSLAMLWGIKELWVTQRHIHSVIKFRFSDLPLLLPIRKSFWPTPSLPVTTQGWSQHYSTLRPSVYSVITKNTL